MHRDFLRVNPLGVTHGPAAQQAELEQDYKLQWHALEINQTGAQMLDDANALSYGNYSFLAPDKDGKDMPVKGFWTATFKPNFALVWRQVVDLACLRR